MLLISFRPHCFQIIGRFKQNISPVANSKRGARLCLVVPVQVNSLRPSDAYMRQ